jgi:hypothetical protein
MLRLSKTAREREGVDGHGIGLPNKNPWSPEEDDLLGSLVARHGVKSWTLVSQSFNKRTGKHCRERWFNHLNPEIKKGEWTAEDDFIITAMQKELGNQWAKITRCLPGRTDNAVKNRFYAVQRANKKIEEAKITAFNISNTNYNNDGSSEAVKKNTGLKLLCEVVFAQAVVSSMFPDGSDNTVAKSLKRRIDETSTGSTTNADNDSNIEMPASKPRLSTTNATTESTSHSSASANMGNEYVDLDGPPNVDTSELDHIGLRKFRNVYN